MKYNRMKRWLALSLALLLLAGCSSKTEVEVEPEPEEEVVTTVAPIPEPEPEPEEEVPPFTNPLTGEPSEEDLSTLRPYAVMLNNLKIALPQAGISQADIVYECPAEGGITRMLAVYQTVDDVGEIGSVRSARDYYVSLAAGMDAIFLHAGGSSTAYDYISSLGVTGLDCVNGPYEGTLYWRDAQRKADAGLEHSVVTSGETISALIPTYNIRTTLAEDTSVFLFGAEGGTPGTAEVSQLSVTYSDYKTGVFDYDEDTGEYWVSQYNAPYVDANDGSQLSVRNVLVVRTDVSAVPGDTAGRLSIRMTGTGSGLFLCDGLAQEITWSRDSLTSGYEFFTLDGESLELGVGSSYINIVDESYTVKLS